MSYIMKGTELAAKAQEIAKNYKTLYAVGAFGAPLNARNKQRYSNNCPQNKRREKLYMAASTDTFVFDCSGMIKGILGGWCGNKNATYGGVTVKKVDGKLVYGDYNFPDYEPNGMIKVNRFLEDRSRRDAMARRTRRSIYWQWAWSRGNISMGLQGPDHRSRQYRHKGRIQDKEMDKARKTSDG